MDYTEINAQTIDRWVRDGWEWGVPITHQAYLDALAGNWDVVLTPTKPVPKAWFGDLKGKRVLGLASGGGQQMPIFAALGGDAGGTLGPSLAGLAIGSCANSIQSGLLAASLFPLLLVVSLLFIQSVRSKQH